MSFSDEENLEEILEAQGFHKVDDEEVDSNESMAYVFEKERAEDVLIVRISTRTKEETDEETDKESHQ